MNSAPSSIGVGKEGIWRVEMRPPMRSRASKIITLRPLSESARAAESPDAPAPMTITSVDMLYPIDCLNCNGYASGVSVSNLDLFIVIDGGFRKYFIGNNDRP